MPIGTVVARFILALWAGTSPAPTKPKALGHDPKGSHYNRVELKWMRLPRAFQVLAMTERVWSVESGPWHSEFVCDLDFEISNPASFDSVRWPTVQLKQRAVMLTEYIEAAMSKAKYEILSDDNTFYGYIPDFDGVYANADDLEACRSELKEVLEEWIMLGISRHLPLPIVDGIRLVVEEAV